MINIKEKETVKLPGITSLFIDIIFDRQNIPIKEICIILKRCDIYDYNPKTHIWELPVINLSFLLDNLTFYDDINLELINNNSIDKTFVERKIQYKTQPFKHQVEAIEYGLKNDKWLLLDAAGLGKSLSMILLAEELKEQRNLKHCLIICGINTLKNNWKEEIKKHSHLDCCILGEHKTSKGNYIYESVQKRAEQLKNKINEFFIITNIETFRSEEVVKAFNNSENDIDMVIVDEAHKIKNQQSIQGSNLLKITKPKYKVALTGTMILNNPLDAFVPLKWIGKERCTLTRFKSFYCIFGGEGGNQIIGSKNLDVLKYQISQCSLRRTKEDVFDSFPEKLIIDEIIDMNDKHKKFYKDIINGVKEEVDKVKINTTSFYSMVTRLRQATACPSILTSNSDIISSKVERAADLAEEIVSNGDKVVIFSTFKETVNKLKELLKEYNPLIITGDIKDQESFDCINKFQNDSKYKIIIATWQKLGTGVTLTAANYMIWIDTPWTEGVYSQGCDRIHRIGTKKSVFIYNLICKDTIDERVNTILKRKGALSDYIVDDKLDNKEYEILKDYIENL